MIEGYALLKEEYEAWKASHKSGEVLGKSINSRECPLNTFLEQRYPEVEFEVNYDYPGYTIYTVEQMQDIPIYYSRLGYDDKELLPDWAREEVLLVDFHADGIVRNCDEPIIKE